MIGALVMGFCRIYLVVHYTTDVIAGLICGTLGGVIAFYLVKFIYKKIEEKSDSKFSKFVLEWNIKDLFAKKQNSNGNDEQ